MSRPAPSNPDPRLSLAAFAMIVLQAYDVGVFWLIWLEGSAQKFQKSDKCCLAQNFALHYFEFLVFC
jgi:hypothetical protein